MNDIKLRPENFKIGVFHGKNLPKGDKEANLRNDLYLKGEIYLVISSKEKKKVRLVAYEMPLKHPSKKECIDLFGIDENWCPYIIELKVIEGEGLRVAKEELERYHAYFEKIKVHIADEVKNTYFFQNFEFRNKTQKIVLANREYFDQKIRAGTYINPPDDIKYFCFPRPRKGKTPIEKRILDNPNQKIRVHIFRHKK